MSATPAPPPPPADAAPRAPKGRQWRWRRLFAGLLMLALAGLVLLAVAGLHLWHDRTAYANRLLQHVAPSIKPSLEALDVEAGSIRLQGLRFHDPETGEVIGRVEEAVLDRWIEALRYRRVSRLRVRGLHLNTTAERLPALLAALPRSAQALETAADTGPASALPLSIEGVDLQDVRVEFAGDEKLPSLAFTLDHRIEKLEWSANTPSLKVADFDLRDFQLKTPDGSNFSLPSSKVSLSFDPTDGMLRVNEISVEQSALELTAGLMDWLRSWQSEPDAKQAGLPDWFHGVAIRRFNLQGLKVKAAGGLPGLTQLSGEMRVEHQAEGVLWRADTGLIQAGRHQVRFTETHLRSTENDVPGHLIVPEWHMEFSKVDASLPWTISEFIITAPDLLWTPQWEEALILSGKPGSAPSEVQRSTTPALRLQSLTVNDGRFRLEKTARVPFDLQTRLDLQLENIDLADSRIESSSPQRLHLREIETQISGSHTASPTKIESIELELRPDSLLREGRVDRLRISKPSLAYHFDFDALTAKSGGTLDAPEGPLPLPAFMSHLHFGELAVTEGSLRVQGRLGAPFETETSFHLETESTEEGSSRHKLSIAETRLTATAGTPLPVARIGRFEAQVTLPELITERRLESLTLKGGQIEFGDALLAILDPGTSIEAAPQQSQSAPQESAAKKWHAGRVAVSDLEITLQRVAPGLPPFKFGVEFEANDTPLEPGGLVENFEPQKIELTSLFIRSPYNSQLTVARLDTIFIHFTLDGLLRRRIAKAEILNPTLYVGEPLFWYVDYYRKFAAGGIKSDTDAPRMVLASAENEAALEVAAEVVAGPPRQAWIVEELQVHSGKIVLAPKGVPLPGFHQPFPFSFTTRLESGQFEAVFDIPSDNYTLPDLKLEFIGMKGQVHFNLPLKDVDNNLTETFTVDQIRWKQLHVEQGYLSVTYDMNGIYGKFGGEAYEGYIEGGFDVYLNDSYTWDGWIAATGVRATEITEKLTPAYLLLDGKFNGTLIAAGDAKELYQADIDCTGINEGSFSIAGLNDMLDSLPPPNTAVLTDQLTRIGLETLRDFDYDSVHAKGRLHGREGSGFLKIAGPYGSRNIEVNVMDHRWKVDKTENK